MAKSQGDGSIVLTTKVITTGIDKGITHIKRGLKSATVALTAFGTATGYLTKQAVSAFGEYEQLVGGVETLFKQSSQKIIQYANEAYKTAGVSANKYMETVTGFSASLLQSLGGDTDKAADIANMALIDMADNANKMGTAMESIQYAYQGFAKQNYTMLDNLKLGYGGTKSEMERLLADAEELTGIKYDISNLADVYNAVHAIQVNLEIAGTTALEAEHTISGSAATIKAAWENVLTAISSGGDIDTAIENLVRATERYFNNLLPVVERALAGIGTLIAKISPRLVQTVANAFIKALPQILSAMMQMIQGLYQGLKLALIELLSGKSSEILNEQAQAISVAAENQEELTQNIKDTNKELEKSLAGFDDLQILGTQSAEVADETLDAGVSASAVSGATADMGSATLDGSQIEESMSGTFGRLVAAMPKWLMAIGCILLLTGNISWGVGLIIAGAIAYEYQEATVGDGSSLEELLSTISTVLAIVGVVAIVLGLLLCMAKMYGRGVGLIAIGAASITGTVALNWDAVKEMFTSEKTAGWIALEGALLIILGILMCVAQQWILGISLIAVGAAGLVAVVALNWNSITDKMRSFFTEWGGLIAIAGVALIIIGILVCSVQLPLGIGLIVAGAGFLIATVALNWNAITDKIKGTFQEYGALIALAGVALIIIGILVCCVNPVLGVGLIAAGAASIVGAVVFNWNAIVDWVKDAWEAVKRFWNEHIAQVFTKDFWLSLAKKCANGLISGFESGINGIISLFETMINWVVDGLNKISFDIPDWVPGIGGGTFGFNIPEVSFGRVSIPRLAKGAVIPANREFLAVLGDQKQGTNIEAPLQTIVDAFNIALAQNGSSANTEIVLEIDGREFGRAVIEQGNKESRRIGTRLVIA